MLRRILFCMLLAMTCFGAQFSFAQQTKEDTSQRVVEQSAISITITGNTIRVQNAPPGALLEVYNVLGLRVLASKLDASDKTFTLNLSKGCYILKIENVVRKVALK